MALSVKSGSFTLNTSTGNQSVTGVGFQPKLVLFWGGIAADGAESWLSFGAATSSTARWASAVADADNLSDTNSARSFMTTKCIIFPDVGGGSNVVDADFVSLDADGFTIDVETTDASTKRVHYLALGGDDIDVFVGSGTFVGATGAHAVTGVGFTPRCTILSYVGHTASATTTIAHIGIGAAKNSSSQWAVNYYSADAQADSVVTARQTTTDCLAGASTSVFDEFSFTSNDADGFTINKDVKDGGAYLFGYVCMGGDISVGVGSFTEPTVTGSQTTSIGFEPDVALFLSYGAATSASLSATHARLCVGVAVSNTDQRVMAISSTDAASTSETATGVDEDECIMSVTGGTPTRASLAELTAFNSTGWQLNWTTVTGNQNQIVYIALAGVAEATFESTGAMAGAMAQTAILAPSITLGTGAMTGAMEGTQISDRTFASTGAMAGAMAAALIRDTEFASDGVMTGTMSAIATILAEFSSTAHMMNFFSQASEEFDVWAVTLDPGPDGAKRYAAYPFTNYDFNSFATLDGLTFAAGDGGTYVLGDFDDDGTDIDAYVQTGKSNVGTERDKRVRVAYVVGTCDEPPLLDVEDGSGNTYEFEGRTNAPDEPQRIKVKLARGMKGGMWGWKLKNQDGSDFDFSDLMVLPEPLSRRVD